MDQLIEPKTRIDSIIKALTLLCCFCIALILIAILISLIEQSLPAMNKFGAEFIVSEDWNPPMNKFGALSAIIGTLITSMIALIISVPLLTPPHINISTSFPTAYLIPYTKCTGGGAYSNYLPP